MVDRREHMGNAIALNSTMFNLARLLGPALGGLLIAAGRRGVLLPDRRAELPARDRLAVDDPAPTRTRRGWRRGPAACGTRNSRWPRCARGCDYAFGFAPIGNTLLLVAAASFTGFAAPVILPILARDVFGGDARTLGWLMSASGVGALGRGDLPEHAHDGPGVGDGHRRWAALRWARGWSAAGSAGRWSRRCRVHGVPGRGRRAADGVGQHGRAEPDGRRQARPGDEPVCDGVHRHDAAGQSGHRRAGRRAAGRELDAGGLRGVLRPVRRGLPLRNSRSCASRRCRCWSGRKDWRCNGADESSHQFRSNAKKDWPQGQSLRAVNRSA